MKDFSDVGIKLRVLTGDKKDTPKWIYYICGLFNDEKFNIFERNEGSNKIDNDNQTLENEIVDKNDKN